MSMNNSSTVNEALIALLIENTERTTKCRRISRLYWTILHQTILRSITVYGVKVTIDPNDKDALNHHAATSYIREERYPNEVKNTAIALQALRKVIPYKMAKHLVSNPKETMRSDSLYQAINDFKFRLNSDFYTLFDLTEK